MKIKQKNMALGLILSFLIAFIFMNTETAFAEGESVKMEDGAISFGNEFAQEQDSAWNNFFKKYNSIIAGISGLAAITFVAFFIFYFLKLGASAGNPQARGQALLGLLWTGIAAAGLGAVSIIVAFFYNAAKDGKEGGKIVYSEVIQENESMKVYEDIHLT